MDSLNDNRKVVAQQLLNSISKASVSIVQDRHGSESIHLLSQAIKNLTDAFNGLAHAQDFQENE